MIILFITNSLNSDNRIPILNTYTRINKQIRKIMEENNKEKTVVSSRKETSRTRIQKRREKRNPPWYPRGC